VQFVLCVVSWLCMVFELFTNPFTEPKRSSSARSWLSSSSPT
jgi:hypothetical protein